MNMEQTTPAPQGRAGMVAVVGRTNVGKSTLLNRILEEKVSIVSPVAQTTRKLIRAILTEPRGQLAFVDTPGLHKTSEQLGHIMNRMARTAVEGVDVVLLVVDGSVPPRQEDEGWIQRIVAEKTPCLVALNKADVPHAYEDVYKKVWAEKAAAKQSNLQATWLSVSALKGDGVNRLVDALFQLVPEGPHLFPDDVLTDYPRKLNMADIIREKLFAVLKDEIPYSIGVEVESIAERPEGWSAEANIYADKSSHKPIIIGHKGRVLRNVRRAAEAELTEMYGKPVALNLWVKVEKKWIKNYWILKKLGYVE